MTRKRRELFDIHTRLRQMRGVETLAVTSWKPRNDRRKFASLTQETQKVATEPQRESSLPVNELSADIRDPLDPFNEWAISKQARRCPAKAATCACSFWSKQIWGCLRNKYWHN